jgi:hypothetical protein
VRDAIIRLRDAEYIEIKDGKMRILRPEVLEPEPVKPANLPKSPAPDIGIWLE